MDHESHDTSSSPRQSPAEGSASRLLLLVYDNLRRLARRYMQQEGPYHTLQPTALVHEVYLQLAAKKEIEWRGKTHFFAVASIQMRRILVDHARAARAQKRGAQATTIALNECVVPGRGHSVEILAIDEALERLSCLSPRQGRIAEMRLFTGLSSREAGEILGVSERTAREDWRVARLWLARELRNGGSR